MICDSGRKRKLRRYRAAVYAQCGSVREVDAAFDALVCMMLLEKREVYYWGVIIDHAPSSLFRTLGDYEIEERIKLCFRKVCRQYEECGFFCILRGRRYGGDSGFSCQGGVYGAIRLLASGRDEGCSLRLFTGDTVERSDRVFILDIRAMSDTKLLPGDISRASLSSGAVAVTSSERCDAGVRRCFLRGLRNDGRRCFPIVGWVPFPFIDTDNVEIYRVFKSESTRVSIVNRGISNVEKAVYYAKRCFLPVGDGVVSQNCVDVPEYTEADRVAFELFVYMALSDIGAFDAVNLREKLFFITEVAEVSVLKSSPRAPGFLRIAFLVASAYCDMMGELGEDFFFIAKKLKRLAEGVRCGYESGERGVVAPFLPCEMVAFRAEKYDKIPFFGGFTALKRICDCFLYLFSGSSERLSEMAVELISKGFDECGVMTKDGGSFVLNALLLCLYAELKNGLFFRLSLCVPELRACFPLIEALPEKGWRAVLDES